MKQKQHIIAVRTTRTGWLRDSDFIWMDQSNGFSNPYNTQDQIINIISGNCSRLISYDSIAMVHSSQPSFSTRSILVDRIMSFSWYRVEYLWWKIDLRENEADTENKIWTFLDQYFQTNKKVLIIIWGLPWVPALMQEWLDIGVSVDTTLEEMQYMFPSGYAFDFTRKAS